MAADKTPGSSPRMLRRALLGAGLVAAVAVPRLALGARVMAPMTEGPFYPPAPWRRGWTDWDADLTRVETRGGTRIARGEHLALELTVADERGRIVDAADVEIWQCDAMAQYRHPNVPQAPGRFDEGFQGFGAARGSAEGTLAFRTIRPTTYPGRTPHIHVKVRHPAFGELTSQLFVAGEPGNEGDFLWRRLSAADRDSLAMRLAPAPAGSGLRWIARHTLVVPA